MRAKKLYSRLLEIRAMRKTGENGIPKIIEDLGKRIQAVIDKRMTGGGAPFASKGGVAPRR
jgi:hypothetical protein